MLPQLWYIWASLPCPPSIFGVAVQVTVGHFCWTLTVFAVAIVQALDAEFQEAQKSVDGGIVGSLEADVKSYLSAQFSLHSGDRPHLMKF